MKTITRFNKFATTTLIGGLAAILPLWLIFIIFQWLIGVVENYLEPLVKLFEIETRVASILAHIIIVTTIIFIFFLIGLVVQTKLGNKARNFLERKLLMKIPGYKTASDIVRQLFGGNRSFFSEVVLVDVYNSGTLMTGFVTDKLENSDYITVFVPTGPNPTTGFVFHVSKDKVIKSDITVEVAIKTIISCGSGSTEVFEQANMIKK
ncbi:MAG: DUF502 domain-containing protein [Prolixibacteraceae bacterium]